jgi:hypothetical protein
MGALRVSGDPESVRSEMARSNMPNGLHCAQQNKHLHGLSSPLFHDAEAAFKKCCFAEKAAEA